MILPNVFVVAGAGTGKTERIVSEAIGRVARNDRVLVLTYTENNQNEVGNRFLLKHRGAHHAFTVKGLLTFYLEELIRPYQRAIFPRRIEGFILNDSDPHKRNGRNIAGRSEKLATGAFNPRYYPRPPHPPTLLAITRGSFPMIAKLATPIPADPR